MFSYDFRRRIIKSFCTFNNPSNSHLVSMVAKIHSLNLQSMTGRVKIRYQSFTLRSLVTSLHLPATKHCRPISLEITNLGFDTDCVLLIHDTPGCHINQWSEKPQLRNELSLQSNSWLAKLSGGKRCSKISYKHHR